MLGQGAVVLLITDGLDREGARGLAEATARLRRSCRRLVWLNPLLRFEGFQPRSEGIRAMLPHVDEFRTVHNLNSLRDLVQTLSKTGPGGRSRHERRKTFWPPPPAGPRRARQVALATVVETWGSSPRPAGSRLAVTASGRMAGSVSGGCIEGAVAEAAQKTMATGAPQLLDFGISDERAWEVGLACGGKLQVFVERLA